MFYNKNLYFKKKNVNQMAMGDRLNGEETKGGETGS